MISLAGENSADVLPDHLSIIGREMEIDSSRAGVRPTTGAAEAELIANTSGVVTVIAASMAAEVAANLISSEPSAEA